MKLRARGFTLMEALISLAVLSIGLLGAAAMLLDSMRTHADALRRVAAANLARDMADRIRANPLGRAAYDTRSPAAADLACNAASECAPLAVAAADLAHFASAAGALFPAGRSAASIAFEPAIGTATPDRFMITLDVGRDPADRDVVVLNVLAQSPVAG